jgi:cell division protein ZapE
MRIFDEYNRQLQLKHYDCDPAQELAVKQLAKLQQELELFQTLTHTLQYKIKSLFKIAPKPPRGIYLWGDVGRGKTWLMDMFFDTLNKEQQLKSQKLRLHFHHFMQTVHDQLSLLQDQKNPLQHIARSFASRYQLLCLDEFHVSDITDAMLLYGLLNTLFEEGITVVATSNIPPDNLYKNGLQRDRFLPAINLINKHMATIELNGEVDHRLRLLEKADTWYIEGGNTHKILENRLLELTTSAAQRQHKVHINYRHINTVIHANDIIWLDFAVICGDQRGSADYIEIARQYHTVLVSNIPRMDDSHNDKAKRFINMIDEFYDRNVNLLASADGQPEELYSGRQLNFEFKRTVSRLLEMRSHDYMQQAHKTS